NGLLDVRQAPAVAIVKQETALGTEGVLTEVALRAPGRFAAFDDVVTLAVRATNSDERHGPFLPKGGCEDEAQCDSILSPSPLFNHYPRRITRSRRAALDLVDEGCLALILSRADVGWAPVGACTVGVITPTGAHPRPSHLGTATLHLPCQP